jgi:hypothetical protein
MKCKKTYYARPQKMSFRFGAKVNLNLTHPFKTASKEEKKIINLKKGVDH